MPDPDGEIPDRGLWAADDQAETAREAWVELPESLDETSDMARAARTMARIVSLRACNPKNAPNLTEPTVVLISPKWHRFGKALDWTYVPCVNDGSQSLTGSVFLCPPNLGASYMHSLPSSDLGEAFEWIESHSEIQGLPALALNPRATIPELRVYELGLSHPERVRSYPLYLAELDLATLDDVLKRFYDGVVCAPGGGRKCTKLWRDAQAFKPVPRPEKAIQNELARYFHFALPRLRAIEEEDTPLGRLDIKLSGPVSSDNSVVINHAVIELKALVGGNKKAPYTNTETIKKHVKEGVRQAASYRKPPSASRIALLSCYDMRAHAGHRGDTCLDHVRRLATRASVEIRRWPLFPSVGALREHLLPEP